MGRVIGIRHRTKKTAAGTEKPTMVHIVDGERSYNLTLKTETDELDFARGRFPVSFRPVEPNEDLSKFPKHHILMRTVEEDGKEIELPDRVPDAYDGLRSGDLVAMSLGGSGDRFAYALSRKADTIGSEIYRIPPFTLAEKRGNDTDEAKERDHHLLASLIAQDRSLFYEVNPRERGLIRVRELSRSRRFTMRDRIRCLQRLRQRTIGRMFLSDEGGYPEGRIEDEFDRVVANDELLNKIIEEESRVTTELRKAVRPLDIWKQLFEPVEGCGEVLAADLITAIVDIRRFATSAKLKAYCGVHVLPDGRIPRKRLGVIANWSPEARQALYQLGEQFNRRPNSVWGQKLLANKARLREKHPETVVINGKKRYYPGHIHKMALWRTISRFAEWLHAEWWRLERQYQTQPVP